MRNTLTFALLFFGGTFAASAISCGTLAVPGSCVINAGGQVQYTFSNFTFVSNFNSGGAPLVTAADVSIDVVSGGGLSAVLEFDKVVTQANPNVVFLSNSNGVSNLSFSYDVSIAAIGAGTVSLINPAEVELVQSSFSANGSGAVQFVLPGAPTCQAITTSTLDTCTLPAGTTTTLSSGNILTLSGNTGNASIGLFTNTFNASFTPTTEPGVPEPASFVLFGGGLAALYLIRRRH